MSDSLWVTWLCQFYAVLLYAYPRQFRRQFGTEMQQVFRDRCSYVLHTGGPLRLLRFGLHSALDWLATTVREGVDSVRAPAKEDTATRSTWRDHLRMLWTLGRRPSPRGFVAEWSMTILVYLFATTTLVQAYVVPTGSMEGNLRIGDHILVDRLVFSETGAVGSRLLPYRDIARGDIVAFLYPEDIRQTYVKRVIGLPGDRIRLVDKQVIRNGKLLIEPYTRHIDPFIAPYRDNFPAPPDPGTTPRGRDMLRHHVQDGELVVPPECLFVMGDNRENSADSRYWGFVPRSYVVGTPLVVYWSFDAPTEQLEEWSFDHVADVALHFFTKTRWDRFLLVPRSQAAREVDLPPQLGDRL